MMILAAIMLSLSAQAAAPPPPPGPVPQMRGRGPIEAPRSTGTCAAAPLDLAAIVPVVEVAIGGRGPYRFAVDTGAQGHRRIRRELAEELGLAVTGQARTPAPGGAFEERPVFALPALAVGASFSTTRSCSRRRSYRGGRCRGTAFSASTCSATSR